MSSTASSANLLIMVYPWWCIKFVESQISFEAILNLRINQILAMGESELFTSLEMNRKHCDFLYSFGIMSQTPCRHSLSHWITVQGMRTGCAFGGKRWRKTVRSKNVQKHLRIEERACYFSKPCTCPCPWLFFFACWWISTENTHTLTGALDFCTCVKSFRPPLETQREVSISFKHNLREVVS